MIIYRGIAYIILGDQASGGFPEWFSFFGWGTVAGIPFITIVFVITAVVFGILLHKTTLGRIIYGLGFNEKTCKYSGIKADKAVFIVFALAGLMSAITAIFLTSRMGSTRPNVAVGYELEIITMVALGGVSTSGGIGRIGGPILSGFHHRISELRNGACKYSGAGRSCCNRRTAYFLGSDAEIPQK